MARGGANRELPPSLFFRLLCSLSLTLSLVVAPRILLLPSRRGDAQSVAGHTLRFFEMVIVSFFSSSFREKEKKAEAKEIK